MEEEKRKNNNDLDIMDVVYKIKKILVDPTAFFEDLKEEKDIWSAVLYFSLLTLVSGVLGVTIGMWVQQYYIDIASEMFSGVELPEMRQIGFKQNASMLFIGVIFNIASSFIVAGILHVWITIFGGKAKYLRTYQLYVYAKTPHLLFGWIPLIGGIVWLYTIFLLIIGTQKLHGMSRKKAILIYVIPLIAFIVFSLVTLVSVVALFRAVK